MGQAEVSSAVNIVPLSLLPSAPFAGDCIAKNPHVTNKMYPLRKINLQSFGFFLIT